MSCTHTVRAIKISDSTLPQDDVLQRRAPFLPQLCVVPSQHGLHQLKLHHQGRNNSRGSTPKVDKIGKNSIEIVLDNLHTSEVNVFRPHKQMKALKVDYR